MLLHHPEITSISWGGTTFSPDERGVFDVPAEAAADLAAFGLQPYAGTKAPQTKSVSQWSNDDLKAKAKELGLELAADIKRPDLIKAVTDALAPKE